VVNNAKMALDLYFVGHRYRPSHPLSLGLLLKSEASFSVQSALQINQLKSLRLSYKFKLPYIRYEHVVDFAQVVTTTRRTMHYMKRGFFILIEHYDAEIVLSNFFGLLWHDPRHMHKFYRRLIVLRCLFGTLHSTASE
jgi:hypothetical protein